MCDCEALKAELKEQRHWRSKHFEFRQIAEGERDRAEVERDRLRSLIAAAEKWVSIRPSFHWSYIDTDYARELLAALSAPSPEPERESPVKEKP